MARLTAARRRVESSMQRCSKSSVVSMRTWLTAMKDSSLVLFQTWPECRVRYGVYAAILFVLLCRP